MNFDGGAVGDDGNLSLQDESSIEAAAGATATGADPDALVRSRVPRHLLAKYEMYSYRGAVVVLAEKWPGLFKELLDALDRFEISTAIIRKPGGNESEIPKLFSELLRPIGWHETVISGDLDVTLAWKQLVRQPNGKMRSEKKSRNILKRRFLDGHKIDYVKDGVAFDLEWNSKDQTFDRDLYAFNAFSLCGVIDAGVLVTRSDQLNEVFRKLGPALDLVGGVAKKPNGEPRMVYEKYGASTTWMGKLLYRLNAGRNGSCPVLAIGIKPGCISDWNA